LGEPPRISAANCKWRFWHQPACPAAGVALHLSLLQPRIRKPQLILPYLDLDIKYFDLGLPSR
jgi:hypothetical protein